MEVATNKGSNEKLELGWFELDRKVLKLKMYCFITF
jgi:hypothetical protein